MSNKKLFLSFISNWEINSNEVRSFLEYFQNSNLPFQLVDLTSNLYKTSEKLTEDNLGFTAQCQLPNNTLSKIIVSLITSEENLNILTFELGENEVIDYLLGKFATDNNITWLRDLMAVGGRMMGTKCVQLSLEERANQTIQSQLEDGFLYLKKVPLMLWTSAFLSPQIENLKDNFWRTEFQWDGAWLLVQNKLPREDYDRPSSSVWIEEGKIMRYFLIPNNIILAEGNTIVRNIEDKSIEVDEKVIARFEVSEETAKFHTQNQIQNPIAQSLTILDDLILNSQNSESSSSSNLISENKKAEILVALLSMTKEEAENNPDTVKAGFINLLKQFKEIVSNSVSNDKNRLETANLKTKEINSILAERGIDTKGILEQFPNNLQTLSSQQSKNFKPFISRLDLLCSQLETTSSNSKEQNLDEIIRTVNESYQKLFKQGNEEKILAKQQEKSREIAKKSLKEAREKHPMPSLKFEDLWPKD